MVKFLNKIYYFFGYLSHLENWYTFRGIKDHLFTRKFIIYQTHREFCISYTAEVPRVVQNSKEYARGKMDFARNMMKREKGADSRGGALRNDWWKKICGSKVRESRLKSDVVTRKFFEVLKYSIGVQWCIAPTRLQRIRSEIEILRLLCSISSKLNFFFTEITRDWSYFNEYFENSICDCKVYTGLDWRKSFMIYLREVVH